MEAASREAAAEGVEKTIDSVAKLDRTVKMTRQEIIALTKARQMQPLTEDFAALAAEGDRFNVAVQGIKISSDTATTAMEMMIDKSREMMVLGREKMGEGTFASEYLNISSAEVISGIEQSGTEVADKMGEQGSKIDAKFKIATKRFHPESLPKVFEDPADGDDFLGLKFLSTDASFHKKIENAATIMASKLADPFRLAIIEKLGDTGKLITDALEAAGPFDVDVNAAVKPSKGTTVDTPGSALKPDAELISKLAKLDFSETTAVIATLPENIAAAMKIIDIESQTAAYVNAEAMTAENLNVTNSDGFKELVTAIAAMSAEQKTSATALLTAFQGDKVIDVDLFIDKQKIGTAMKAYRTTSGESFKIHVA